MKLKQQQQNFIIQNIINIQSSGKGSFLYNNEEYKVDRKQINKALDGDTVLLKILNKKKKNKAEVIKIIKRSTKKYLGILKKNKNYGFVLTKSKNIYTDLIYRKTTVISLYILP